MSVLINELEVVPAPAEDQGPRPEPREPSGAETEALTAVDVRELMERADERCLRVWAH